MAASKNQGKAHRLILGIAAGRPVAELAVELGVSIRTARRWAADPESKRQVRAIRDELVGETVGRLSEAAVQAVETLRELLKPPTPPATRARAARAILAAFVEIRTEAELLERIQAIEEMLGAKKQEPA